MNLFSYSLKKVLIHLLIILGVSILLVFLFLKIYLPIYTNHGETVSVPDLSGYTFDEAIRILESSGLHYEVSSDSGFSTEHPALGILKQIPEANTQVKSDRKIFLTLNAQNAPLIKMPELMNMPLKNVQEILANLGLERGEIIYVPDIGTNVVLELRFQDNTIQEGFEVAKGSRIDLVVGDGNGNQNLLLPSLIGMDQIDAEFLILGNGLRIGRKTFNLTDSVAPGEIYLQIPSAGTEVQVGDVIDLWISKK